MLRKRFLISELFYVFLIIFEWNFIGESIVDTLYTSEELKKYGSECESEM